MKIINFFIRFSRNLWVCGMALSIGTADLFNRMRFLKWIGRVDDIVHSDFFLIYI